ncbi:hypothetical protein E6A50_11445 [Brachyspira hampsonii]|nr:hypothetical protein [Brachyspira hampsonii]
MLYLKRYDFYNEEKYLNLALDDFNNILMIDSNNINAISSIALIYFQKHKINRDEESLKKHYEYIEKLQKFKDNSMYKEKE